MDLTTMIGWVVLYRLLPRALRTAIETTADALVEEAVQAVGARGVERIVGSSEERRIRKYLARAVALTLRDHPELGLSAFATDFRNPPFSDCLLQVLTSPETPIDPEHVDRAFAESHYDLTSLGIDPVNLIREMQQRFVRQLKADQRTRDLWIAAVVERVASDTAALRADLERREARDRATTPLLSVDQFFGPWLTPDRLFSHAWTIVGRIDLQNQLAEFARGGSVHQLAVLPGRGGIGKTRLLLAVADGITRNDRGIVVRIAAESRLVSAEDLAALPDGPVLLLIDDAHRREDLEVALSAIRRAERPIQIVMTTRPYGADTVRATAARVGFDRSEVLLLPELTELDHDERIALAHEALGEDYAHLAEALADVTRDSPLITVVGGQLLAQESVAPGLLAQHDEFRRAVLGRMADEYVEAVGRGLGPERVRRILELVAAIGPVHTRREDLIERAAGFLEMRPDELQRALGNMEEAGILLRRGASVRITPDVLADFFYHEAAMAGGRPTGYSDEVFRRFSELVPHDVLANLAELDWRARHAHGAEIDLLKGVWADIEASFRTGTHYDRVQILEMIQRIAVFQPRRVLGLVELALERPEPGGRDDRRYLIHRWSAEDVIRATPPLLQRIAYLPEYRTRAFDLLWELGRDDERALNSHPEHPVRILSELAGYDNRRLEMAASVLEAVERWVDRDGVGGHAQSELDVVDPILEKAGSRMTPVGHQLTFQPYFVDPDATRAVRERALRVVRKVTENGELHAVIRGVESLSQALRNPMGHFGTSPSDDLLDRWLPEQLQVVGMLREMSERPRDPLVILAVLEAVSWHAVYGRDELKEAARGLVHSIDWTFELLLTEQVSVGRYRLELLDEMDGDGESQALDEEPTTSQDRWKQRQARQAHERERLADSLVSRFSRPDAAFAAIEERLQTVVAARQATAAGEFLATLAQRHPEYGETFARRCLDEPQSHLAGWAAALIDGLRTVRPETAVELIEEAAASSHPVMRAAAASALMRSAYGRGVDQREIDALRGLLRDGDTWVLRAGLSALAALARSDGTLALAIASDVELGSDSHAADELFGALAGGGGRTAFGGLSAGTTSELLAKLDEVTALDGHWTGLFLNHAAEVAPRDVVQLFLRRARRGREDVSDDFRAMPYRFENALSGFSGVEGREDLLREIRDEFIRSTGSEQFWMPRLFAAVSQGPDPVGQAVLNEWICSREADKIRASVDLLGGSDWRFVLQNPGFVADLIREAEKADPEGLEPVLNALHCQVAARGGMGTPGEPMPHDVEARDEARRIAMTLPVGSPERRLYEEVVAEAERSIRLSLERDAEFEG